MFDVTEVRAMFPILKSTVYGKKLAYLDSGATAQKPQVVIDKIASLYSSCNANIHRGAHYMSGRSTQEYEEAREVVREFIGASSSKSIVFTSGATAAINLVASSYGTFIGEGDEILVSEMEHHSNIVPWQLLSQRTGATIKVIPFLEDGELDMESYTTLLTPKCKIVAITQASNVLGTMPDLSTIIEQAHAIGAKVMVDGCQGIVHGGVDVEALDIDFYAFSGHKLYAPTGIGVLYGKEELLEAMPPYMGGGDMVAKVTFTKTTYAELPLKFEAGTSNYIGAIALAEAIRFVSSFDKDEVEKHMQQLLSRATELISSIEGVKIYGTTKGKCSIVSFNVEGVHPYDLALLLDKQGVAVRSGTHCAEPVMEHFGITGNVRASFALYNTLEEVDALHKALVVAVNMLR